MGKDPLSSIYPIQSLEYGIEYLPLPLSPPFHVNYDGKPLSLNSLQLSFCRAIAPIFSTLDVDDLGQILNTLRELGEENELEDVNDPALLDFSEIPTTKLPHTKKPIRFVLINGSLYSLRSPVQQFKVHKTQFVPVGYQNRPSLAAFLVSRDGFALRNARFADSSLLFARP